MRISILTQPLGKNYGGILQAFAMQKILENLHCEVQTIDRRPNSTLIRKFKGSLRKWIAGVLSNRLGAGNSYIVLSEFMEKHLKMSSPIESEMAIDSYFLSNNFDVVLVGSDQVWRPKYSPSLYNFYLDFLERETSTIRKISYAASFGVSEWEYSEAQTKRCRALANQFDAISVREESAVALCRNFLGVEADHVLDPTLLLNPSTYVELAGSSSAGEIVPDVLVYFLDDTEEKQKVVTSLQQVGRRITQLLPSKLKGSRKEHDIEYLPTVESWLKAFLNAKMVLTDSFHGVVFSMIFHKPFFVIGNTERGMDRFNSLLSLFRMQSRLLSLPIDNWSVLLERNIDWEEFERIKLLNVDKSISFLIKTIGLKRSM